MLRDGHGIVDAFWYIKEVDRGWTKSDSTLMEYIMATYEIVYPERTLEPLDEYFDKVYPDGTFVIGRQRLFYALMTLDEKKMDKDLADCLDVICKEYPVCETIRTTFKEFHDIIIVDKDIDKRTPEKCAKALENLQAFIAKHKEDELRGFAKSLQSDIRCVSNAITMRENSGGVEGRNCKYKAYLRASYGHIKRETLEQKLKLGFMYTSSEFSFAEIAPWLVQDLPA